MEEIVITIDLQKLSKRINKHDAFQYAYLKWKHIVANDGYEDESLLFAIPALRPYEDYAYCTYCLKYADKYCVGCPLYYKDQNGNYTNCFDEDHPFQIWLNVDLNDRKSEREKELKKEAAQKVLDMIIRTQPKLRKNENKKI